MKFKFAAVSVLFSVFAVAPVYSQYAFLRNDAIVVKTITGTQQKYAWAGGLNFSEYSQIDLDFDGNKDLFVFDRAGYRILPFINQGTPGQIGYTYSPGYTYKFPEMQNWALLRDYNGDGKEDIFTSYNGGAMVYLNVSNPTDGVKFKLVKTQINSFYSSSVLGLFISPADLPAIDDIDGDGDLDILTFSLVGSCVEYHQNQSMELYGVPDSLGNWKLKTDNWGLFYENLNNNSVTLNDSCDNPNQMRIGNPFQEVFDMPSEDGDGSYDNERHQGSTEATLDVDGDGDKELFLGDVSFSNILMLTNGGTAQSANIISSDLTFPSYDTPVNIELFPATFFVDVNNDGKPEMINAPNTGLNGENFTGISLFNNIGGAPPHTFDFARKDFLQGDMIDVGENALPTLYDYNNDGLLDLIVANYGYYQTGGSYKGGLALYKNTGTATVPEFTLLTRDWCNLAAQNINFMAPSFGDLDGDGKPDLVTGDRTGNLHFFKNIASTNDTTILNPVTASLADIDVGGYSAPQIYDLDKDGLLDLIVGEKNGNVNFFKNTGTTTNYIFSATPQDDYLGEVSVVDHIVSNFGYSVPFAFDSAGTTHLVVGSQRGDLFHYTNIDNNLTGIFTLQDSLWAGFNRMGQYAAPVLANINGDTYIDLFAGVSTGGVSFYSGKDPLATSLAETVLSSDVSLWPNPANGTVWIAIDKAKPTENWLVTLRDVAGRTIQSTAFKGQKQYMLDVTGIPRGMYFVTLSNSASAVTKKLVVN